MKRWYRCPICKKKLIQYNKDAEAKGIFLLCKNCKKEIEAKSICKVEKVEIEIRIKIKSLN